METDHNIFTRHRNIPPVPAWPAVHLKTRTPQEGDLLDLSAERVRSLGEQRHLRRPRRLRQRPPLFPHHWPMAQGMFSYSTKWDLQGKTELVPRLLKQPHALWRANKEQLIVKTGAQKPEQNPFPYNTGCLKSEGTEQRTFNQSSSVQNPHKIIRENLLPPQKREIVQRLKKASEAGGLEWIKLWLKVSSGRNRLACTAK